jgi:zinc-finger-containing domain
MKVICPYCGVDAKLITGDVIYRSRPDLSDLRFYFCKPCDAYVGTHKGTLNPLGRMANAELRKARMAAHAKFDPLWKSGGMKRNEAYKKLSDLLGIHVSQCHIAMFELDMCKRVLEVLG